MGSYLEKCPKRAHRLEQCEQSLPETVTKLAEDS